MKYITKCSIDKSMQDHGLFQAICRVNGTDGDDKEYGYIIDYKDLFKKLEKAVGDYTSAAFDNFDKADVEGLLNDRLKKAKERLEEALESIYALCEGVKPPKDTPAYIHYFCAEDTANKNEVRANEPKRKALYKQTASLTRAYSSIASEMESEEVGYTASQAEEIKKQVAHYESVRKEVQVASGDYIDLKSYEPAMRHLIDTYIKAEEGRKVSAFDDFTLIDLIVNRGADAIKELPEGIRANNQATAETIENNLRRLIVDRQPINPKYYEEMSIVLDELIKQRKEEVEEYEKYLAQIIELTRQVSNPANLSKYPKSLDSAAKKNLYDNLNQNEQLALDVDNAVYESLTDDWLNNLMKLRKVENAIKKILKDKSETDRILEVVKNQVEYLRYASNYSK